MVTKSISVNVAALKIMNMKGCLSLEFTSDRHPFTTLCGRLIHQIRNLFEMVAESRLR